VKLRATWFVGAALAVLVAAAFVVAITQTSDTDAGASASTTEVQPVSVIGTPLPAFPAEGELDTAIGMPAPILDGLGFTGNKVTTLSDAPMLMVFLAHWCQHCQHEVPVLVRWNADGGLPSNLDVVAVTTSTDMTAPNYPPSQWLAEEEWPPLWPVLADDASNSAGAAFGLSGFPFMVLTDADGIVLWRHSGRITADDLQTSLEALLG
jgi:cytochrome c biogenesis protein CcmG, thiol:disulfide interchange protein DsbE